MTQRCTSYVVNDASLVGKLDLYDWDATTCLWHQCYRLSSRADYATVDWTRVTKGGQVLDCGLAVMTFALWLRGVA